MKANTSISGERTMTARAWQRREDHDGLLQGMREAEAFSDLDQMENLMVPLEEIEIVEKCHLCEKNVWPDDPTSIIDDKEVHRVCWLEAKVAELEHKLSELSYRVPV